MNDISEAKIIPSQRNCPTKPIDYAKNLQRILDHNPDLTVETLAARIEWPVEKVRQHLSLLDQSSKVNLESPQQKNNLEKPLQS